MTEKKVTLSKRDRWDVMWHSQFLQGSWNYERMQNGGWAYSMIPALRKLYPKKEDMAAALQRHLVFFNTHPYLASPIIGVTLALEEDKANGVAVDDEAIQGVKVGMMGPLIPLRFFFLFVFLFFRATLTHMEVPRLGV